MAQTLDQIYIEEKHMPGKHDQTTHGGDTAPGVRQDSTTKTPPNTTKVYREQLLKQRSALATQLDRTTKPEKQAEIQKQIKELDKQIKTIPSLVQMTPAKHSQLMRNRSALATELDSLANRSGPKSDERKAQIKKKITNIDTLVRENPLPKTAKAPKNKVVAPKPTSQTTTTGTATPVAAPKQTIWNRVKNWLEAADAKIGEAFNAVEAYTLPKLSALATRIGQRREVHRLYDNWNRKQARANNTNKQMKLEFARPRGKNGIPSRKFYETAVRFRNEQIAAEQARHKFESMVGFTGKSISDEAPIERLESPYEKHLPGHHDQMSHAGDETLNEEDVSGMLDAMVSRFQSGDEIMKGKWERHPPDYSRGSPAAEFAVLLPSGEEVSVQFNKDTIYSKTKQRLRLPQKTAYVMTADIRVRGVTGSRQLYYNRVVGEGQKSDDRKKRAGELFRRKIEKQFGIVLGTYDVW